MGYTKQLVDTLYGVKLTNKRNKLSYYLSKIAIKDKLEELGYEQEKDGKCSKGKKIFTIETIIHGWTNEQFMVETVFSKRTANRSLWFTQDEFNSWLYYDKYSYVFSTDETDTHKIHIYSKSIYNYKYDSLRELYSDFDFNYDVCWDIETKGLDRHRDDITSIQFSWISKESGEERLTFIPFEQYSFAEWRVFFKNLAKHKMVAHNGKFDSLFIWQKLDKVCLPLTDDTLVMSHCTNNDEYGLKPNVIKYFKHDYDISTSKKIGTVDKDLVLYGLLDVYYTRKLKARLEKDLDKYDTRKVYNYEMRAYRAYYEVEKTGVPLSPRVSDISKQLEEEYSVYGEELQKVAKINWNSNDQVALVMFSPKGEPIYGDVQRTKYVTSVLNDKRYKTKKEATEDLKSQGYKPKEMGLEAHTEENTLLLGYGLGLKPKGKTKSGKYAVGKDTLAEYSEVPIISTLIKWKNLVKLKQFPDSWAEVSVDGRIYPSFNLTARTGRTTCSNPNLDDKLGVR